MPRKQARQRIEIDPDFTRALFLGRVEDELQAHVQMRRVDVVCVFLRAVAGVPEVSDDVAGAYHLALIRAVLPQVGVIVVAQSVKAADANAPSAVLVPSHDFHDSGFDGNDRRARQADEIVAEMAAAVAVGPPGAEVVVVGIVKPFCNGREGLQPVCFRHFFCSVAFHRLERVWTDHSAEDCAIGL